MRLEYVSQPKHDKTATALTFSQPYRRVRRDEQGLYVMHYQQKVYLDVALTLVEDGTKVTIQAGLT